MSGRIRKNTRKSVISPDELGRKAKECARLLTQDHHEKLWVLARAIENESGIPAGEVFGEALIAEAAKEISESRTLDGSTQTPPDAAQLFSSLSSTLSNYQSYRACVDIAHQIIGKAGKGNSTKTPGGPSSGSALMN